MEKLQPENKLEKKVYAWLKSQARDYDDKSIKSAMNDLMQGGCQSGIVGSLIYYTDTIKFFRRYRVEINALLVEALDNSGCSIFELFGDKWEKEDPLAQEEHNQNLLAWFGFEESAVAMFNRAELEW